MPIKDKSGYVKLIYPEFTVSTTILAALVLRDFCFQMKNTV